MSDDVMTQEELAAEVLTSLRMAAHDPRAGEATGVIVLCVREFGDGGVAIRQRGMVPTCPTRRRSVMAAAMKALRDWDAVTVPVASSLN